MTREFLPGGQVSKDLARSGAKAEKPDWKAGYQWKYTWKQAARSGAFTNEIVREEAFEGNPAYVIRNGNNEDYYVKDNLGMVARKSGGKVVFKRSDPRLNFLWPLEIGKEWTNSYLRENVRTKTFETFAYKMTVTKMEELIVPAGTFLT